MPRARFCLLDSILGWSLPVRLDTRYSPLFASYFGIIAVMHNQKLCLTLSILNFSKIDVNGSFLPCFINQCCWNSLEPRTICLGIHWSIAPWIQRMLIVRGTEEDATRKRTRSCYIHICYFAGKTLSSMMFIQPPYWLLVSPMLLVLHCIINELFSTWLVGHYSNKFVTLAYGKYFASLMISYDGILPSPLNCL